MRKLAFLVAVLAAFIFASSAFAQYIGPYLPFKQPQKEIGNLTPAMDTINLSLVLTPQTSEYWNGQYAVKEAIDNFEPNILPKDGLATYIDSNDQEYSLAINDLFVVDPREYGDADILYSLVTGSARLLGRRDYMSEIVILRDVILVGVELSMVPGDSSFGCNSPDNWKILLRINDSSFISSTADTELDIKYNDYGEFKPFVDYSPECNSSGWYFFFTPQWPENSDPAIEVLLINGEKKYLWDIQ